MSSPAGYPASVIGKLLLISQDEVDRLSRSGVIPKPSKGMYELAPVVQAYVKHIQINRPMTQVEFAALVGVNQSTVSRLLSDGVLDQNSTGLQWLQGYIERLQEQAAGRQSMEAGGLDLVQERAALAREQRHGIEIRNAVARGEYAPITLLAEVMATASQSVVERFDQLPAALRKTCPDLPEAARDQVMSLLANARNEWVRATADLVAKNLAPADDADLEPEDDE